MAACTAFAWPADSPLAAAEGGRVEGSERWAWLFLGCVAAALLAYAAALAFVARLRVAAVAAVAAAIQLTPLAAPLLLSTDAWTYWLYGRIAAVHDGDPYVDEPVEFRSDPALPWIGEDWRESTSVYGPGFTLASEPLAVAAGESADAAAWIFKTLAAACVLGAAALAARLSRRPSFALAFVAWNPLLALHLAGGGHNDAWIALLVVGALALADTGRRQLAGAAWALAVLVKWVPAVLLALRALQERRRFGWVGLAAAGVAVAALASLRYGPDWLRAFGPLARNANRETSFALPHRLEQLGLPEAVALAIAGAGLLAVFAWLARGALRGRARLGLAAVAVLCATPYLAPWYLVWAVPLAAAEDDRTAQALCLALCAYLLPQTVPV